MRANRLYFDIIGDLFLAGFQVVVEMRWPKTGPTKIKIDRSSQMSPPAIQIFYRKIKIDPNDWVVRTLCNGVALEFFPHPCFRRSTRCLTFRIKAQMPAALANRVHFSLSLNSLFYSPITSLAKKKIFLFASFRSTLLPTVSMRAVCVARLKCAIVLLFSHCIAHGVADKTTCNCVQKSKGESNLHSAAWCNCCMQEVCCASFQLRHV